MLKRALKQIIINRGAIDAESELEAANAQTGIETQCASSPSGWLEAGELEAANAQTGIETLASASARRCACFN